MLGPLVNPSSPQNLMLGTFNLEIARLYNYILQSKKMTSSEDDEDNKYRCEICNLGYSTHNALNLHKQYQHRDGKYPNRVNSVGNVFTITMI